MSLPPALDLRLATQVRNTRSARRKEMRRLMVIFAVPGALVAAFADPPLSNMWVLCALGVVFPALWLLASIREHPGLGRLRALGLRDAVWIYVVRGTGTQFQIVHLMVRYADRSTVRVPIELGACDDVLMDVAAEAPRATIGYTPEHERAFAQDPLLLRS